MNLIIIKSLFLGIILGFLQSQSFLKFYVKKYKNLDKINFDNNKLIFNSMLFSILRILFLFSLLVFLVVKLQINMVACVIGILLSFGISLFSALKGRV